MHVFPRMRWALFVWLVRGLGDGLKMIFFFNGNTDTYYILLRTSIQLLVRMISGNNLSLLCHPNTRCLYIMGWTRSYFALQNDSSAPLAKSLSFVYAPIYTHQAQIMLSRVRALRATLMSNDVIPRDWVIHAWANTRELYTLPGNN